jgi:hypothetical protein
LTSVANKNKVRSDYYMHLYEKTMDDERLTQPNFSRDNKELTSTCPSPSFYGIFGSHMVSKYSLERYKWTSLKRWQSIERYYV